MNPLVIPSVGLPSYREQTPQVRSRFERLKAREVILIFHHQIKPASKNGGAFFSGPFAPRWKCFVSGIDGNTSLRCPEFWDGAQNFASGGIVYVSGRTSG